MKNTDCSDQPKVSVVLPTRNRYGVLYKAINSVFNQTYTNWEIVIVIDTDDIREYTCICDQLIGMGLSESVINSLDERKFLFQSSQSVRLIRNLHSHSSGAAYARNLGIQRSQGNYIAFLDSDDLWSPEKIELQLKFMLEKKLWASHTDYYAKFEDSGELKKRSTRNMKGKNLARRIAFRSCLIATPTVMFKPDQYALGESLFPVQLKISEDLVGWLRLSAADPMKFGHLPLPLTIVNVGKNAARFESSNELVKTFVGQEASNLGVKKVALLRLGGWKQVIFRILPRRLKIKIRELIRELPGDVEAKIELL